MLGLVLGAGLALLSASRPWVRVVVTTSPGLPSTSLAGSGNSVGPVSAVALVALAAAGGLLAARSALRRLVALLASLAGSVLVVIAVLGLDTSSRSRELVGDVPGAEVQHAAASGWAVVALLGGVLVLLAGLVAVRFSGSWPTMGARFDRAAPPSRAFDPRDQWTALDRGSDPTLDPVDERPVDPPAAQRPH